MHADAIAVSGLRFEYPGVVALDDVSFTVGRGTVTALVGPNGAGKTTLLRCVAGLDRPMLGGASVAGIDVLEEPRRAHERIGYLSDFYGLYDELTVAQCLRHAAAAHGVDEARATVAAKGAADRLEIADLLARRCGELSRGQRQRVAIGQALVHAPEVLLLDEPASGLDPEARHLLASLFKRLQSEGMTLLVSSHILAELDEYSTHMLVLRQGHIVENRELARGIDEENRLRIVLARAVPDLAQRLSGVEGLRVVALEEQGALITVAGDVQARALVLRTLVERDLPIATFAPEREDLHASYLRTVRQTGKTP
jgi:ABC-2 type transport system ATP-binding protein